MKGKMPPKSHQSAVQSTLMNPIANPYLMHTMAERIQASGVRTYPPKDGQIRTGSVCLSVSPLHKESASLDRTSSAPHSARWLVAYPTSTVSVGMLPLSLLCLAPAR